MIISGKKLEEISLTDHGMNDQQASHQPNEQRGKCSQDDYNLMEN